MSVLRDEAPATARLSSQTLDYGIKVLETLGCGDEVPGLPPRRAAAAITAELS